MKLYRYCLVAIFSCVGMAFVPASWADSSGGLSSVLTNNPVYQRELWFWKQRAYPLGEIPLFARMHALNQINQIRNQAGQLSDTQSSPGGPPVGSNFWVNIGPAPILNGQVSPRQPVSGRIEALAVDPNNVNHWLAGAAQGGVWGTRDAGGTWTPLTDDQASLAMGAVAFAPSSPNIIYAGTGEAAFSGDSYAGAGLLKSSDGGVTWQLLATNTFAKSSFSHIRVSSANPNALVATTTIGLAGRSGDFPPNVPATGIFKSTDGGVTWTATLKGEATGLDVDPANFNNQYGALGFIAGAAANGVYRSSNSGTTWTRITGPWSSSNNVGRIELAIAPSSPATLYVSIQDTFTFSSLGVWRTDNAWDPAPTWTQLPPIPAPGNQFWYDHVVIVDPADANILYLGETPLWKYDGTSWLALGGDYNSSVLGIKIHPDQHALAWAGNTLIVGNDGGVWTTSDGGNTFANRNTTLAITQFYEGSVHPTNANFAIGGSQDNGSELWTGSNPWQFIWYGDGCDNAISSSRPNTDWAVSSQGLNIVRTKDAGVTFEIADNGIDRTFAPFVSRFEECPANSDIFVAGTDQLWKTTNFFSGTTPTWVANSPASSAFSSVSALAFAPSDPTGNTYAYGSSDGSLLLTSNGGATWTGLDPGNTVPNRFVTGLAFSPTNANILYVTLSGFDEGTPSQPGHVFKTSNALSGAATWVNVSTPVNLPHNTVVVDPQTPSTIYVGTDLGVWQSVDGGSSWSHMGPESGMPNVAVFELKINRLTGRLYAFTHGRSALMLPLAGSFLNEADVFVSLSANPNPVILGNGNLTYNVTLGNNGSLTASNAMLTQNLPGNVIFVSATTSRGTIIQGGGVVTCTAGNIPAGGAAVITVVVTPIFAGTLVSTASAHSDTTDNDTFNNTASAVTQVIPPTSDLAVGLDAAPNPVLVGGTLTYTVSVTNNGPSIATGVVASNALPASAALTSATPSQGTTTILANAVLFNFGSLGVGAVATATITVIPSAQGLITATATVTANQFDPLSANNTTSLTTSVSPSADLAVGFQSVPASIVLGNNLTYTINATNLGPSTAASVLISQALPPGATVVSSNTTAGTLSQSGNTINCDVGALAVGGTVTMTVVVSISSTGTVSSTATISGALADVNTANNSATVNTLVAAPFVSIQTAGATLTAESFVPPDGAVEPGEVVTVQFYLANAGNIATTNLMARLLATGGVTLPSAAIQTYGPLAPGGFPVSKPFSFTAGGTNGGVIMATLQLSGDVSNTVSFTFTLPQVVSYANTNVIVIPEIGSASPYPSTLNVVGVTGLVGKVTATLSNFNHTFPHDVSVLLVAPSGASTLLMSHAADFSTAAGVDLTFDDSAATPLPASGSVASGSWQASVYAPAPVFFTNAPPATNPPAGPYSASMALFNGSNPNGVWMLFVMDDSAGDQGGISNGWSLAFTTIAPVNQVADLSVTGVGSANPVLAGSNLTNTFTVINNGTNSASAVAFTNVLPANVTLISATASQGSVNTNGGKVVVNLGSMNVGAGATVMIVMSPTAAGPLTNTATVFANEVDLVPGNNTVTLSTTVNLPVADVSVSNIAAPNPVIVGSNLVYTISVANNGPGTAINVVVTDTLPSAVTYLSSSIGTFASGTLTCNLGNLAPGVGLLIYVTNRAVTVGTITNTATATTGSNDSNPGNNSASVSTVIRAPAANLIATSAKLLSESFTPPDGVVDAGETVSVSLGLSNTGEIDTTSLVATLLNTGGVTGSSGAQNYGAVINNGPAVLRNFSFTASSAASGVVTATLQLQDGATSLGTVAFTFTLPQTNSFANTNAIIIPDHGSAAPYPAVINVSGLAGFVSKATVRLNGVTHSFPHDIGVLLVSPSGAKSVVMSGAGGGSSISNLNLTFDDAAAAALSDSAPILPGTYQPTDNPPDKNFPTPAPVGVATNSFARFNGTVPNGAWSLYVVDSAVGDSGVIAGGWSLALTTVSPINSVADLSISASGGPSPVYVGNGATYTLVVTNKGPTVATAVVVSNTLPAGATAGTVTHSQGTHSTGGGLVVFNVGNLGVGAGATMSVAVNFGVAGLAVNTASVSANEADLNLVDNIASASVNVLSILPPDLAGAIVKTNQFQITLSGQANFTYIIQASTNITAWTSISTNTAAGNGVLQFTDTNASSLNQRYYRAVVVAP